MCCFARPRCLLSAEAALIASKRKSQPQRLIRVEPKYILPTFTRDAMPGQDGFGLKQVPNAKHQRLDPKFGASLEHQRHTGGSDARGARDRRPHASRFRRIRGLHVNGAQSHDADGASVFLGKFPRQPVASAGSGLTSGPRRNRCVRSPLAEKHLAGWGRRIQNQAVGEVESFSTRPDSAPRAWLLAGNPGRLKCFSTRVHILRPQGQTRDAGQWCAWWEIVVGTCLPQLQLRVAGVHPRISRKGFITHRPSERKAEHALEKRKRHVQVIHTQIHVVEAK